MQGRHWKNSSTPSALYSWGHPHEPSQTWRLKAIGIFSPSSRGQKSGISVTGLTSKCRQGRVPSRGSGSIVSGALPAAGACHCSLACVRIAPLCPRSRGVLVNGGALLPEVLTYRGQCLLCSALTRYGLIFDLPERAGHVDA